MVDVVPGQPAQVEEVLLSCGRPLVRWKARGGLAEIQRWLDEGRDAQAFVDLEVWLDDAMSLKEIQTLRRAHDGIIHIRPVYPEMEAAGLLEQRAELPVHELFRKFYQRQTGGAQPEDRLVQLFLELVDEDEPGVREEVEAR